MQQISNKTLTLLLLIAIIVSIAGTIISINRINQLILQAPIITAMASSSGTGMVNVSVAALASITATDTVIQFGSCSPNTTSGTNLSSNNSNEWGAPGVCSSGTYSAPDNLTIENDGNKNLNVTVQASSLAKTFIGGTVGGAGQAEMWFSVRNASSNPGCFNQTGMTTPTDFDGTKGMQWSWKNFSVADTEYLACANLTYGSARGFSLFAKLFLPANAPPGANRTTTLTFTAVNW